MAFLMNATMISTAISTIMLCVLFSVYIKNYLQTRSKFTIGLMIFIVLFLLQNITSLYYFLTMMDLYAPQVAVHVFVFSVLQMIAFGVFLKITWE